MTPYLADPDVTLYQGDALDILRELPDESVHCVATSPPFYGLRDYGVDGQIGLEASPDEWAARLVEVFREARRVLRRDGSLWVECGDSYASNVRSGLGIQDNEGFAPNSWSGKQATGIGTTGAHPYKPKDLVGQPFLLAFALRADGWYWRGVNIWAKPNAMPESAKDRCTVAHSYVLHFSKSARYFFDGDAIAEPAAWERWGDQTVPKHEGTETAAGWIPARTKEELWTERASRSTAIPATEKSSGASAESATGALPLTGRSSTKNERLTRPDGGERRYHGFNERWDEAERNGTLPSAKHPRSVWTIPTQGFPEAHFATWPEALARRIILAAVPEQVCGVCGKARERIVERELVNVQETNNSNPDAPHGLRENRTHPRASVNATTTGFTDCGHGAYQPGTVLDPFAGSGTTLYVARKHNRRAIGIDLSEAYLEMAARRLAQQSLFAEPSA